MPTRGLYFPDNIGEHLSLDETCLTNGDLYTVITNRDRHGKEGCLVGIVAGTKSEDVITALDPRAGETQSKGSNIRLGQFDE